MKLSRALSVLGIGVFLSSVSFATGSGSLQFGVISAGQLSSDFAKDNQAFRGVWDDQGTWKGPVCGGRYDYHAKLEGRTDKVDIDLHDDGTIDVVGKLSGISGRVSGGYKSIFTGCMGVGGWLGVGLDSASFHAIVTFTQGGKEDLSDLKVRIVETKFGTIHIGKAVPHWFENFLTNLVNRAAQKIWSSKLGDWLSKTLSAELKKQFPHDGSIVPIH